MSAIQFSILIIDDTMQSRISYEVESATMLEDVIIHLCNSFEISKFDSVRTVHDQEIVELRVSCGEILEHYGSDLKLIVQPPRTDEPDHLVEDQSEWTGVVSKDQLTDEIIDTVIERIVGSTSADISGDISGEVEIVILPLLQTYITQLRVRYHVDKTAKEFFTRVAITCGYKPREIVIVPLIERGMVISDMSQSVRDLITMYGPVFVLLPFQEEEEYTSQTIKQWISGFFQETGG